MRGQQPFEPRSLRSDRRISQLRQQMINGALGGFLEGKIRNPSGTPTLLPSRVASSGTNLAKALAVDGFAEFVERRGVFGARVQRAPQRGLAAAATLELEFWLR